MIAFVFVFIHPFGDGNGRIHRYFDATPQAEYLYGCVIDTVRQDLPNDVLFLEIFDRAMRGVMDHIGKDKRANLTPELTDTEIDDLERIILDARTSVTNR